MNAMLPAYERMLNDDPIHYRQLNNADLFFSEYMEMKHFCSLKVIELSTVTRREETLLTIVQLLNKILQNEEVINFKQSRSSSCRVDLILITLQEN